MSEWLLNRLAAESLSDELLQAVARDVRRGETHPHTCECLGCACVAEAEHRRVRAVLAEAMARS